MIRWAQRRANMWVRYTVGVEEEEGLLRFIKRQKLTKYSHGKRRPYSLVSNSIEEQATQNQRDRRKVGWIDNIKQ